MESLNIGNKTSDDIEAGPERNKPARVVRKGVFAQVKTVEKVRQPRDDIYTICKNLLPACSYTYTTPKILEPLKDRVDDYFECIRSGSSVETEVFAGIINFFSCMYVLPVLSHYMENAGYVQEQSFSIMALLIGIGSIVSGLFTNTPLIIAPPTPECIFLVAGLRNYELDTKHGNIAVIANGAAILILGLFGPLGRLIVKFIPSSIQIGTTVGIGLLTALAGSVEISLVQSSIFTVLKVGPITPAVLICLSGFFLLGAAIILKSGMSNMVALLWGTFVWWCYDDSWPSVWLSAPEFRADALPAGNHGSSVLSFSLIFLTVLTVFGVAKALSDKAEITRHDGSVPNQQTLILIIGCVNIASGIFYGPAFTISAESCAGIRVGAKTGLAAVICGCMFLGAIFFGPLFVSIPPAATTPILIFCGMQLFMNVQRIDFNVYKYSFPAFCTLFFIPFTSSTLTGLVIGYSCYIFLSIFTLDMIDNAKDLWEEYFPAENKTSNASISDIENSGSSASAISALPKEGIGRTMRRASTMALESMTKADNFVTTIDSPVLF